MFKLEGLLEDPQSGWQLVFVDNEKDTLLVGDDPWEYVLSSLCFSCDMYPTDTQQIWVTKVMSLWLVDLCSS
jgi:hypothetical protein